MLNRYKTEASLLDGIRFVASIRKVITAESGPIAMVIIEKELNDCYGNHNLNVVVTAKEIKAN